MVLLVAACSVLSGFNLACFKMAGLAVGKDGNEKFIAVLLILGALGALSQLMTLNLVMSLYKQVEVGPCY
jgi:hypothetical protein